MDGTGSSTRGLPSTLTLGTLYLAIGHGPACGTICRGGYRVSDEVKATREIEVLPADVKERLLQMIGPRFSEDFDRLVQTPREGVDVALETEQASSRVVDLVVTDHNIPARLERNLARKGMWATDPDRKMQEIRWTTEDVVGSLTIDYALGQLSVYDMELVSWIMGRWNQNSTQVKFYLRECAREFGISWGGSRSAWLSDALRRIDRTRFTGRVWEEKSHKFVTRHFGIFDDVQIVERKDAFDGPSVESGDSTVTVTMSTFMHEQLVGHHFVRLDWDVMRSKLKTPLGRRLYAFVESQKGWSNGTVYEITIDAKLVQTLGSKDTNLGRFRTKLRKAGDDVTRACPKYLGISIRAGKGKKTYVLTIQREAA